MCVCVHACVHACVRVQAWGCVCASVFACVCLLVCMFHKGLCDIAFVGYI